MSSNSREVILISSSQNSITVYDAITGAPLAQYFSSCSPRKAFALAGNNLIATSHLSSTASGFIRLYNWWSSSAVQSIATPEPVGPLVATLDGSYIFSGGLSGYIHVANVKSAELQRSFRAHCQPVSCLVINYDNSLLISGSSDGTISVFPIIRVLDAALGEDNFEQLALNQFTAHSSSVTGIAFASGGCNSILVSCSLDATCKLWNLIDGTLLRIVQLNCAIWCVVMEPTGCFIFAGGSDGRIRAIPLKTRGKMQKPEDVKIKIWEGEHRGTIVAVALVKENQNLISASEDGLVKIWDVKNGIIINTFSSHEGESISDLLVANRGGRLGRAQNGDGVPLSSGSCKIKLRRKVGDMMEMERSLNVIAEDKKKAVNMLHSTVGSYKELLRLVLKETKG